MEKLEDYIWARNPLPFDGIVDMHAHMGTYNQFPIAGSDADSIIRQMDRVGVKTICCSHHVILFPEVVHGNNEILKAMKRHPGRILGYAATYPTMDDLGIDEVRRCVEQGMIGIKLHNGNKIPYESPEYEAVWEFSDENKLPVLLHTWGDIDKFECVFEKYRNVKILLGHAGSVNPEMYVKYANKYDNAYLELCHSLSKYNLVEYFVENVPIEKIIWGSDTPWMFLGQQIGRVVFADITEEEKKAILVDNPGRILGERD